MTSSDFPTDEDLAVLRSSCPNRFYVRREDGRDIVYLEVPYTRRGGRAEMRRARLLLQEFRAFVGLAAEERLFLNNGYLAFYGEHDGSRRKHQVGLVLDFLL